MMKKEWYIFQGTHHKGPFSKNDLLEFYLNGSIKRETLLWREEEDSWEPIHKIPELRSILESISTKDLGSESKEAEDISISADELPEFIEEIDESILLDELPPPLPVIDKTVDQIQKDNLRKRQLAKVPEKFKDPTRLDLPPVPELLEILNQHENESKFKISRYKWVIALIFVVVISTFSYFAMRNFSSVPQSLYIRGLNPQNLERLEEVVHKPLKTLDGKEDVFFDFALTVDGKEIWLASNMNDNALIQVTLSSKANRSLGAEEIIIESRAKLTNHKARFQKIRILKGNSFNPGEYGYKIKGKRIFWLNNFIPMLQKIALFNNLNKDFSHSGDTIIYSGTKTDFEYRLIEYRKELMNSILRPYEEKLEKTNTLKGLVQKTFESLSIILTKKNPQDEMKDFESFFIKEISPILQSIVNDSNQLAQTEIVEAAKLFGESATDIIAFVKSNKKWNSQQKSDSDKALKRLKAQVFYLEMQMKKIESDISKIKSAP